MNLLLGGIPLGCDNIGDEAIIAAVVKMLKASIPDAKLTVATADPATAERLGVETVPAFGFAGTPVSGFAGVVSGFDTYIWCGATGLSDYPHVALDLIEIAQKAGVATYIWGVGMDDELNPAFFTAHGKRQLVLKRLGLLGWYERRLQNRLRKRIASLLPHCRGVWLRDGQSAAMLAKFGFANAGIAADTAILLAPEAVERSSHPPTMGLCISTQRRVADLDGLKRTIEAVRASGARVLGIPMNPKTDRALLTRLGVECIEGTSPEAVMEAAAQCDVVLSSRLHLLILAANVGTPGLGIARGSKLANWLANFGETVEGSVYDCDWDKVTSRITAALNERGDWETRRAKAYIALKARLECARADLVASIISANSPLAKSQKY